MLRVRAELERRGVTRDLLAVPETGLPWEVSHLAVDAGSILRPCDYAPIHDALQGGENVVAVRLPGFGGLLTHRTQPGVTFAREFADRVRVIACLQHRPFMIHSGLRDYGLDPRQWRLLRRQLKADTGDALLVVWGPEQDAATAVREIVIRARDALAGVPAETRQAFDDGTNGFERILPGPDRMYPDTDTPPLPIADDTVIRVRQRLPETPWSRRVRYEGLGLEPEVADRLAAAPWGDLFDGLDPPSGAVARRVALCLEHRIPHQRREGRLAELPEVERVRPLVDAVAAGTILPQALEPAFDDLVERGGDSVEEILAEYRRREGDMEALSQAVAEVASRSAELVGKAPDAVLRWAMGEVMPRFVGRIAPSVVRERLQAVLRPGATEVRA